MYIEISFVHVYSSLEPHCKSINLLIYLIHLKVHSCGLTLKKWKSVRWRNSSIIINISVLYMFNLLTPNDPYMGLTAPLTSKRCILYIYSTNIGTEYFKHALYCPFFSLQNAVCFIMLTCLVPVLFTFYIQGVLK